MICRATPATLAMIAAARVLYQRPGLVDLVPGVGGVSLPFATLFEDILLLLIFRRPCLRNHKSLFNPKQLPSGRSVIGRVFACDDGLWGYITDPKAGGNMPADQLPKGGNLFHIFDISFCICITSGQEIVVGIKVTFCLIYPGSNIYY